MLLFKENNKQKSDARTQIKVHSLIIDKENETIKNVASAKMMLNVFY